MKIQDYITKMSHNTKYKQACGATQTFIYQWYKRNLYDHLEYHLAVHCKIKIFLPQDLENSL